MRHNSRSQAEKMLEKVKEKLNCLLQRVIHNES